MSSSQHLGNGVRGGLDHVGVGDLDVDGTHGQVTVDVTPGDQLALRSINWSQDDVIQVGAGIAAAHSQERADHLERHAANQNGLSDGWNKLSQFCDANSQSSQR